MIEKATCCQIYEESQLVCQNRFVSFSCDVNVVLVYVNFEKKIPHTKDQ